MKPFNLEEAKAGKPIVCRDGTAAKFIAHVPEVVEGCRVVAIAGDRVFGFHETGRAYMGGESLKDLFMAPEKRTVWLNVIRNKISQHEEMNGPWGSKLDAASFSVSPWKRIACLEVTFTEGQGLD